MKKPKSIFFYKTIKNVSSILFVFNLVWFLSLIEMKLQNMVDPERINVFWICFAILFFFLFVFISLIIWSMLHIPLPEESEKEAAE